MEKSFDFFCWSVLACSTYPEEKKRVSFIDRKASLEKRLRWWSWSSRRGKKRTGCFFAAASIQQDQESGKKGISFSFLGSFRSDKRWTFGAFKSFKTFSPCSNFIGNFSFSLSFFPSRQLAQTRGLARLFAVRRVWLGGLQKELVVLQPRTFLIYGRVIQLLQIEHWKKGSLFSLPSFLLTFRSLQHDTSLI